MRCAQSATVPCRRSCGQCSDARFVFNACILDMSLIHVDMYLIHVDLRLLVWRESHVIAVNVLQGCFVARCIKFVLCCHMCVSCVSQSPFRDADMHIVINIYVDLLEYPLAERPGQPLARITTFLCS